MILSNLVDVVINDIVIIIFFSGRVIIISLHLVHVDGQHNLALCLQHDELLQGHVDPAVHAQEHVSVVPGHHFLSDSILFKTTM